MYSNTVELELDEVVMPKKEEDNYSNDEGELTLDTIINSNNVADLLDEKELTEIAGKVIDGFEQDEGTTMEWRDVTEKAMEIAQQVLTQTNEPLSLGSNVKYPAITQSSIEFASRTYPNFVKGDRIAKFRVVGTQANEFMLARASRVERFISYKMMHKTDWEDQTDKLLHMLPVVGTVFKKVYYDPISDSPVTELCSPFDVVVNHNVESLKKAPRITHILEMSKNDIKEKMTAELFSEIDLKKVTPSGDSYNFYDSDTVEVEKDTYTVLEQHCYHDLDGDGYEEPYIITVMPDSRKVLRIVANFKEDDVIKTSNGDVLRINNETYFVDYHFIRNPDGGFYSLGLGQLLYPINEAINTVINQLIDAGTLNNLQGGFIGRALRIKSGELKVKMGEWKSIDTPPNSKISDHIYPLPTKEPSPTLFQLLGLLIETVKDLARVNEATQGNQLAQNAPVGSVMTLVEQGLVVFNAIEKRIYRSFKKELEQIYKIYYYYLDDVDYQMVLNEPAIVTEDFKLSDMDITPVANPGNSSTAQRLAKAQAVANLPSIPPQLKDKLFLEALEFSESEIQQLIPPPQPNPQAEAMAQAEIAIKQAEAKKLSQEPDIKMADVMRKAQQDQRMAQEAQARINKMEIDGAVNMIKVQLEQQKLQQEAQMDQLRAVTEQIRQINEMMRNQRDLANDGQKSEIVTIETKE